MCRGRPSKIHRRPRERGGPIIPGVAVTKIGGANFPRFRNAGGYGSQLALAGARLAGTTAVCSGPVYKVAWRRHPRIAAI